MRMLYLEPGLLKHPQGSSPPPSLSLGPVNFRFHLLQQHPSIFDQKIRVGGSSGGFFVQRGCWSCHYKSGLEMCFNAWREVKCCVESSKMFALMSPIEGTFEFRTKNSGTTSHLWKKHTQMTSVTLKVQTCESCFFLLPSFTNFTMSHVILGVFQKSGTSVRLCLHLVWFFWPLGWSFFWKCPASRGIDLKLRLTGPGYLASTFSPT